MRSATVAVFDSDELMPDRCIRLMTTLLVSDTCTRFVHDVYITYTLLTRHQLDLYSSEW